MRVATYRGIIVFHLYTFALSLTELGIVNIGVVPLELNHVEGQLLLATCQIEKETNEIQFKVLPVLLYLEPPWFELPYSVVQLEGV